MASFGEKDERSALEAKSLAQKIAFAPLVFHATMALRDLGILGILMRARKRGVEAESIASELNLPLYGVKVLLEAGLGAEVVYLDQGRFHLTKTGYFILSDELTQVNMNFVADVCYRSMSSLQKSIVDGRPAGLEELGNWSTIYEGLSQLPEKTQKSWLEFDHFYSDDAFPEVLPLVFRNRPRHIVDVGGNTGKWALKCLEYDDQVRVTILDLPHQIEMARQNLASAGGEDRCRTMAVNVLEDGDEFPSPVDVIWMSQFLDCFSESEIVRILKRARGGMGVETSLFVLETFWDKQRFEASAFSLVNTSLYFACIANGNSKMYHSDDMKKCAELAGLVLHRQTDGVGIGHTLLEYKSLPQTG